MNDRDEPSRELAPVYRLPIRDGGDVVEAEVLTPEEWDRLQQRKMAQARMEAYRRDVVTVARVTRTVVTHPHTVTTAQTVGRHAVYTVAGAVILLKRVWASQTNAELNDQLREARIRGDFEARERLAKEARQATADRHNRFVTLVKLPFELAKATGIVLLLFLASLLFLGIAWAGHDHDITRVLAPIEGVVTVLTWLCVAVAVSWAPFVAALPAVVTLACWWTGRRANAAPTWLATSAERDADVTIDESTVARALGALRIPQITSYLKDGHPLQFLTPCRLDGRGTFCSLRLPSGVTAALIGRRRAELATGLHRLPKEVWPTTGGEAGILDLWIADKGALADGAGPYPLLDEGGVDVFKGVPFGRTLRGTPVTAPVMERNSLCGGQPGQGKSSAARAIMAGAALDPTAELRIWVPDANFDFEAFKPRCSRYVMGAEDERIEEILHDLRELHAEIQSRGELLIQHEIPAVTRLIANQNVGLHPLFCLLEEAHVAIEHADYGQEIAKLLVNCVRLGRKRGIHIIVSTQAPTKASIPRDVTRNCSNGIAFAVGDHIANDALLGQGAYSAGHRATELIPGADRGTAVVKGFTGERSDIVQVYFISIDNTSVAGDQITPIIKRSLEAIERRGRMNGPVQRSESDGPRDLLHDVHEAFGADELVRAADMVARLRALAPGYAAYERLDGKQLAALLTAEGALTNLKDGNLMVRANRVLRALDERQLDD